MDKKTELVFEYFEKKYGFDIEKLGIDKYQIQHIFQNNHRYFDKKDSIKILILHIEKMIDTQIKDNKQKIISNKFLNKDPEPIKPIIEKPKPQKPIEKRALLIDSKDRDILKYKFPSKFSIPLKNSIKNEIFIKEIILRNTSKEKDSSDNLEKIPYLILDLSVGKNEGTNKNLESASCILGNYETKGDYRYFNINTNIKIDKEIKELSVILRKPDGNIYNFGSINNDYINTVFFLNLLVN